MPVLANTRKTRLVKQPKSARLISFRECRGAGKPEYNFTPSIDFSLLKKGKNHDEGVNDTSVNVDKYIKVDGLNTPKLRTLGSAVLDGDLELLQALLAERKEAEGREAALSQALHMAVATRQPEAARVLLHAGAICRPAALLQAVELADDQLVRLLLDHGAHVNAARAEGGPLHLLARRGNVTLLKTLLEVGADVNQVAGAQGLTPLIAASQANQLDAAELLLQHGASVNASDACWQRTPLHWVAINGNRRLAEKLLAAGAELHLTDKFNFTPLMYSVTQNQSFVIELLLQHQDVNGADDKGRTALHLAAESGSMSCVRQLLAAGADLNVTDEDGRTPLMVAAEKKRSHVVRALAGKSQLSATNKAGLTAFHLAVQHEPWDSATCRALREAGADLDEPFPDEETPLMKFAADNQRLHWLLQNGVNPNITTTLGQSALWIAARRGNVQCVQLLLKANAYMEALGRATEGGEGTTAAQEALARGDLLSTRSLVVAGCGMRGLASRLRTLKAATHKLEELQQREAVAWLEARLRTPRTLEELARTGLRSGLGPLPRKTIQTLPLPKVLKNFVALGDLKTIDPTCFLTL